MADMAQKSVNVEFSTFLIKSSSSMKSQKKNIFSKLIKIKKKLK